MYIYVHLHVCIYISPPKSAPPAIRVSANHAEGLEEKHAVLLTAPQRTPLLIANANMSTSVDMLRGRASYRHVN